MGNKNNYKGLDEYAVKSIRIRARQLVGKAGLVEADIPDLEQELAVDLWRRLPSYDPARATRKTFIARVVEHQVATILEARRAACRDVRREAVSLADPLVAQGDQGGEGWATSAGGSPVLDQDEIRRRSGSACLSEAEARELRHDLEATLRELSPDQRDLCRRILDSPMAEVALELGVPRTTLHESLRRVRAAFARAGLSPYLGKKPRHIEPRPGR